METKHTPGPWNLTAVRTDSNVQTLAIDGNGGRSFVAEIAVESRNGGEWLMQKNGEADARLIAAAPDLVEALRWATELAEGAPLDTAQVIRIARAALAKAGVL